MPHHRSQNLARPARRSPPAPMRERDFAQAVVDLGRWCGWRVYRTWNSRHSPRGFPDVVLVRPPAVVIAELKSDCGRVSPAQEDWLQDLEQCPGIEVYLWRPADWDTIAAPRFSASARDEATRCMWRMQRMSETRLQRCKAWLFRMAQDR